MYLLLSGEGSTDIGSYKLGDEGKYFEAGPMGVMIEQIINQYCFDKFSYEPSLIESNFISYISKPELAELIPKKNQKKGLTLPGVNKNKETGYFFKNAKCLALKAKQLSSENSNIPVIGILFRDKDGNSSSGNELWIDKYNSIKKGFKSEDYIFGVPMIPNAKSEAWLLCAVKNKYQYCNNLENIKGNDDSPNSLKSQLASALDGKTSAIELAELVKDKTVDVERIDMNSFNQFRQDLQHAVKLALKH